MPDAPVRTGRLRALSVPCGTIAAMRGSESAPQAEPWELPEYAERVLGVAERIPPGRVMTYGDVAGLLREEDEVAGRRSGGGPRQVGRVMALYGGAVPWWRVVRSDGVLLPGQEQRALELYREEDTPLRGAPGAATGHLPRLDIRGARWDGAAR